MKQLLRIGLVLASAACGGDGTGPGTSAVTGRTPPPGATGVSVASSIQVAFSRDVTLPDSDNPHALLLEQALTPVPVLVTQPNRRTLVITPVDVLDPAAHYVVSLFTPVTLGEPVSWDFTTGGRRVAGLDGQRLLAQVQALAHDSMAGRGSGTADELRAAQYIAAEFARSGLEQFSSGRWLYPFTVTNLGSSQNVVGVLRGEGALRDEWVIVGAHYDHVGVRNGQIYNGADDNASGTAGMLELARALVQHANADGFGSNHRRSIMFIAFGMEELGLVGSYFYCQQPLVPLSRLVGMINLDMIGRLRANSLNVIGENSAREWPALLRRYDQALSYVPLADAGTDHRCFRQNGRPVMSLFTGLHAEYHQPGDDPATLDVAGMRRVADLALALAINLAVRPRPLTPP